MKKLAGIMGGLFKRPFWRAGHGMRGRVHKISIIAGGEVSIVIRCGLDEPRARQLLQGTLIEFFETREGIPPRDAVVVSGEPGALVLLEPHQRPLHAPQPGLRQLADGCTCSAGDGERHALNCGWWAAKPSYVRSDGCTCGAPGGYPHEADCGYWDAVAAENLYDRESAGYPNRTIWEQLPIETKSHWIDRAKATKL